VGNQSRGIGGRYFEDCNEARVLDPDAPNTSISGVAAYALDPDNADRLWDLSVRMLQIRCQPRSTASEFSWN
jgi:hypothetical protein